MNKLHKALLTGVTVLSLGAASFTTLSANAATEAAPAQSERGHRGHDGKSGERMQKHMAKRQAELHEKLKLTAAQEPAWKTFTASMTPAAKGQRPDRAEMAKLSAPERMERRMAMMQKHQEQMGTRLAALKTFYATLTPEQQKTFDEVSAKGHGKHHGKHQR